MILLLFKRRIAAFLGHDGEKFHPQQMDAQAMASPQAQRDSLTMTIDTQFKVVAIAETAQRAFFNVFGKEIKVGDSLINASSLYSEKQKQLITLCRKALLGEITSVVEEFILTNHSKVCYEITYQSLTNEQGAITGATCCAQELRLENQPGVGTMQP